jgi:hypothetical protein
MRLDADIDEVFQQLASFDQGPTIIERNGNQIIAEFPVTVGWLRVTTLERVSLDPDRHRLPSSNCAARSSVFARQRRCLSSRL